MGNSHHGAPGTLPRNDPDDTEHTASHGSPNGSGKGAKCTEPRAAGGEEFDVTRPDQSQQIHWNQIAIPTVTPAIPTPGWSSVTDHGRAASNPTTSMVAFSQFGTRRSRMSLIAATVSIVKSTAVAGNAFMMTLGAGAEWSACGIEQHGDDAGAANSDELCTRCPPQPKP